MPRLGLICRSAEVASRRDRAVATAARRCRSSPSRPASGVPASAEDEIVQFRQRVADTGIHPVVAHNSYLINIAAAAPPLREQSQAALLEEYDRADALGLQGLVMHPGSYTSGSEAEGIRLIASGLRTLLRARPRAHR